MILRLFQVPAGEIFEHPPDLPTDPKQIPDGPIKGWECYAPCWGTADAVLGPFEAAVARDDSADRRPYIVAGSGHRGGDYWFRPAKDGTNSRSCWYQSGGTLRFIRKKTEGKPDGGD